MGCLPEYPRNKSILHHFLLLDFNTLLKVSFPKLSHLSSVPTTVHLTAGTITKLCFHDFHHKTDFGIYFGFLEHITIQVSGVQIIE